MGQITTSFSEKITIERTTTMKKGCFENKLYHGWLHVHNIIVLFFNLRISAKTARQIWKLIFLWIVIFGNIKYSSLKIRYSAHKADAFSGFILLLWIFKLSLCLFKEMKHLFLSLFVHSIAKYNTILYKYNFRKISFLVRTSYNESFQFSLVQSQWQP